MIGLVEVCPECGSGNVSDPSVPSSPAECLDCHWIERRPEEKVDELLEKVTEDQALYLVQYSGEHELENYLVRENGVVIFISEWERKWIKTLYSNLTAQYRRWLKDALEQEERYDFELISREEVPEVEETSYIAKYGFGEGPFSCVVCGEKLEDGGEFVHHAWKVHEITEDPREYRDPVQGQQSLGARWCS